MLEEMGGKEIREYLYEVLKTRNLSDGNILQVYSALKFLYGTTLKRNFDGYKIPQTRKQTKLPIVLTIGEVKRILEDTRNLKHRVILMVIYMQILDTKEI